MSGGPTLPNDISTAHDKGKEDFKRTFHCLITTSGQNGPSVDRENKRTGLTAFCVCPFNGHVGTHKIRVGLPHMERTIDASPTDILGIMRV